MKNLFTILPKIAEQFNDSEEIHEALVLAAWSKAAGESLSKHTLPVSLVDKHLAVLVRDLTWKRHLESLAGQMIFKLNSMLGIAAVTFIEFQIGEDRIEQHFGENAGTIIPDMELRRLALDELDPGLKQSAEAITDESLRTQFLLAAGSCLLRRKRNIGSN